MSCSVLEILGLEMPATWLVALKVGLGDRHLYPVHCQLFFLANFVRVYKVTDAALQRGLMQQHSTHSLSQTISALSYVRSEILQS